jgi:hypothetical protein
MILDWIDFTVAPMQGLIDSENRLESIQDQVYRHKAYHKLKLEGVIRRVILSFIHHQED